MTNKIFSFFLRYGVALMFFTSIIGVTIATDFKVVTNPYDFDEHLYQNISANFTVDHIRYLYNNVMETKPLPFLLLQKVLHNADPVYTRTFNFILIIINTILIYKITNNKFSVLFITLPLFLGCMWLTAEMIEIFFILLSIYYSKMSGIFVGLATIFRPSAIAYSLIKPTKKHIFPILIIGFLYIYILQYFDLLHPYWFEVTNYAKDNTFGLDPFTLVMLAFLIIMGIKNKFMLPYMLISSTAFLIKMYPHYFLPVYTFLFIGFLLEMNKDIIYFRKFKINNQKV